MLLRVWLFAFLNVLISPTLFAQTPTKMVDDLHAVSPTAYQFVKYDEMPVSEYTGIPSISIPLYKVDQDGVEMPLTLTYHAFGVRVNQEAGWTGLGWDMSIGSVVQTVNDVDDYPESGTSTKILPDYHQSPYPTEFPLRYQYPSLIDGLGWQSPYPIYSPQKLHSYKIATDYYVPVNGNYSTRQELIFTSTLYDSEPDIFKANFLGHSINFILDFKTQQLVVLNKKGYKVAPYNKGWKIIVPSGEEFYFEEKSVIENFSTTVGGSGATGTGWTVSSKIWMLTKLITNKKQTIALSYSRTAIVEGFPNYSERYQKITYNGYTTSGQENLLRGYNMFSNPGFTVAKSYSTSRESYVYLASITFPKGKVTFLTSDRQDVPGGKKLDRVELHSSERVKFWQFDYGYFDATGVNGTVYQVPDVDLSGSNSKLRLKLLSLKENNDPAHIFSYDDTPLPRKNSLALDLWGFYNGHLTNAYLLPNPVKFNKVGFGGDNGTNKGANLGYAQAASLTQMQLPSGGKVRFVYALNEFDNYWVPDYQTSTNTVSRGNGLRIASVTFLEKETTQSKKVNYSYTGGKAILPIDIFRKYTIRKLYPEPNRITATSHDVEEMNLGGYFSSSLFGSINGVGYDKVIREEVDLNGVAKGRVETSFYNVPDVVTTSIGGTSQMNATLPAFQLSSAPKNGAIKTVGYYDNKNTLLKYIENTYKNVVSEVFYGARIFSGCVAMVGYANNASPLEYRPISQDLIGYYPIFDFESLLESSKVTEKFGDQSLVVITSNSYDSYNQLSYTTRTNSNYSELQSYNYPYSPSSQPIFTQLVNQNRLTEIVSSYTRRVEKNGVEKQVSGFNKDFMVIGDKILESKVSVNAQTHAYKYNPTVTIYDKYDEANGNLLQYTDKMMTSSLLWDYNGQYIIAIVKNAPFAAITYTSFESNGKGNWSFSGLPSAGNITSDYGRTGKKYYLLSGGAITKLPFAVPTRPAKSAQTLSYWAKQGTVTVGFQGGTGSSSPVVQSLPDPNGWVLYTRTLTFDPTVVTLILTGTAKIDELRLYPADAQMTTNTYNPLIGITSYTDITNNVVSYEYDEANRLKRIKDQDGNIIKYYVYHYRGQ